MMTENIGAVITNENQLLTALSDLAVPFRFVRYSEDNFVREFGQNYSVITPIGEVELDYFQFDKIFDKKRERYFGLIKPTFEAPLLVVKHTDSLGFERELFIKTFLDKKRGILYFVSVAKNEDGILQMTSAHEKELKQIIKKIKEGSVTHKINALFPLLNGVPLTAWLNASKQTLTHYTTLEFGFPFTISSKKNAKTDLGNLQNKSLKIDKRIKVLNLLLVSAEISKKAKIEKKIRVLRLIKANSQPESIKNNYSVEKIHLERIKTDTKLFQQRKQEYSERSVNNIINAVKNGTFYWENFDAITLWLNNDWYYILSGHSRYEAFKRLYNAGYAEFSHIPAKIFTGTLEEAQKQIAKKSNTFASKESPLERAKYYQDLRAEGVPEKEIMEEAKINEDKNYTYILALSHLAPEGILVHNLELFQTEDNENAETIKKIAFWIGYVRSVLPLSDKHEAELYNYLLKHDRHKKYNKSTFYAEISKVWQQRELFNIPYTAQLNLENFVSKSQTELNYDENVKNAKKQLKEAIEEKEKKTKELINSIRHRENRNPTDAEIRTIQQILQENGYDASIIKAERELLRLEAQKNFVKQQAKGEMSLFGLPSFDSSGYYGLELIKDENTLEGLGSKKDVYDIINEKILKLLESDKLTWRQTWNMPLVKQAKNYETKTAYSGLNWFMLNFIVPFFHDYTSPYYMTYKQIEARGGRIKKGANAQQVFYYNFTYFDENNKKIDEIKYNELIKRGVEAKAIPFIKYYNVFNITEVEGIDFEPQDLESEVLVTKEIEPIETAERIIYHYKDKPKIVASNKAYYDKLLDKIGVPKPYFFEKEEYFYSVLFHELIHSTKSEKRLNDKTREGKKFGDKEYSFEELIAELGASYLCSECGILFHTIQNNAAYLQMWKKKLIEQIGEDKSFLDVLTLVMLWLGSFIWCFMMLKWIVIRLFYART